MSTIKVDTIATRTGSGSVTVSNNATLSGTLGVTGLTTLSGNASITGDTATLTLTDSSSHSANTGPAISFFSNDSGGTSREVAKIVGESHSGANEGNLALQTRNGGTLETKWKVFKNGNLLPSSTDYGIYLGATAAGDANLLNDYEEGTWTPSVTVGSVSTANGHYKKIGGIVHFRAYMTNFANTTNNESMYVTGLPFTIANSSAVGVAMWENINDDFKWDTVFVNSSSQIMFYFSTNGAYAELRHTHLDGSNSGVHFSGTYLTDQ